jgi:hypothetical protein
MKTVSYLKKANAKKTSATFTSRIENIAAITAEFMAEALESVIENYLLLLKNDLSGS